MTPLCYLSSMSKKKVLRAKPKTISRPDRKVFGVAIADPVVRPTKTTVAAIRKAVKLALQKTV